ncbi:competence protein ComA [Caballeronia arationis]|jgi:Tfp pilus assembly PilM family ATPase|uniref:Type IV pilus assembly protein PilM n=1 Tax=Caballeronia arationis TaxID=1777142 RepID=A0A7Z7I7W9_9BURK|nr:pilus assembly protein PilM [Caballeronia arationis]SAK79740.1 competence protein ComA [Caballeronia arationis]SOE80315.1 Type IV pilus assembly protein PilM [Caballeronia arationis]
MGREQALRGSVLTVTRRYAAGIDVSERAVRVAVVSRRLRANGPVCVEHLESVPLEAGAVIGGDFVDRHSVAAALREAFARLPARGTWRGLRCAMGLPASATLLTRVPISRLIEAHESAAGGRDPLGLLEPAVLAEAERAAGIERAALAVDWSVEPQDDRCAQVSIAATARQHVESRVETAAAAGIALSAIDGEPAAALRAMRHAGTIEIDSRDHYIACWVESTGLYAWLVGEDGVENELRYPSPEYSSVPDALRDLVGEKGPPDWVFVGGDVELLAHADCAPAQLSATLRCPVLPFECAPFCNGASSIDETLRHSPRFAVAFGLALREVMQ